MAAINDLISQIADVELRERIQREVDKMNKQKKFGLVFEEHLPECTPLYDMPVKRGCNVMLRNSKEDKSVYVVLYVDGDNAVCVLKNDKDAEKITFALSDIVRVAEFGEPIYPYLKPIDSVCNAPDSGLWHTLIEADNYHALQLLEYLYAGKVDCIYIDPPYNTGARDWKYNNDYVDGNDAYRHSKWLSFMQKRLKIAKLLLNPFDSVLIITIDEKEYLHLGCLLEDMFPEARIQMISSVINHATIARGNEFNRNNEYIFFVMLGNYSIASIADSKNFGAGDDIHWETLRRHTATNIRDIQHPNQFYPIYVNTKSKRIEEIGQCLPFGVSIETVPDKENCTTVWPIRDDGTEMMWGCQRSELLSRLEKGYVKIASYFPDKPQKFSVQYLTSGTIQSIENGDIEIIKKDSIQGYVIGQYQSTRAVLPKTQWDNQIYDARDYGTKILKKIFGSSPFSYPKSLYAVKDCLKIFVLNKPNALIVDFFAGSGTTLHAVNLLNAEDGGSRHCIIVTNNEVSDEEAKGLTDAGLSPGDDEWEKRGIARNVTWPRTVCSIIGQDKNGLPIKGDYVSYNEQQYHMADGFKANAAFFKLGFLDKTSVALGMRFKEMLPTLWMKAGAVGVCPKIESEAIPDFMILPQNQFAVLINENAFASFAEQLVGKPEIQTVFINTDYEVNYRAMAKELNVATTYQLYRDYLDHFRINHGRN